MSLDAAVLALVFVLGVLTVLAINDVLLIAAFLPWCSLIVVFSDLEVLEEVDVFLVGVSLSWCGLDDVVAVLAVLKEVDVLLVCTSLHLSSMVLLPPLLKYLEFSLMSFSSTLWCEGREPVDRRDGGREW